LHPQYLNDNSSLLQKVCLTKIVVGSGSRGKNEF
jgi:hypothetical protein